MQKLVILVSLAAIIAGCSDEPVKVLSEAETFGYRGRDLEDPEDKMFFSTGPGVTNWVPIRVLQVRERYDFSSNELALVEAAGVVTPALSLEKIPDGFTEKSKEPWFTTWAKDRESFGKKGVSGFVSHYNDVRKLWETGETYFSTYHDSKDAALKALAELEPEVARFAPKKFHKFDDCWVAEYVRLRVMGLCGQRPDGTWTCMLSINDKCNSGCGPWEPVEAQQARVDDIAFKAEVKKWRAVVEEKANANHAAVLAQVAIDGYPLFGEEVKPRPTGDGRMVYVRSGVFPMSNVVDKVVWREKAEELAAAAGAVLGEVKTQEYGPYVIWYADGTNRLFTVRQEMAFPKPSTNEVDKAKFGEWGQLCFENVLPGFEPPPPPQRKR